MILIKGRDLRNGDELLSFGLFQISIDWGETLYAC